MRMINLVHELTEYEELARNCPDWNLVLSLVGGCIAILFFIKWLLFGGIQHK